MVAEPAPPYFIYLTGWLASPFLRPASTLFWHIYRRTRTGNTHLRPKGAEENRGGAPEHHDGSKEPAEHTTFLPQQIVIPFDRPRPRRRTISTVILVGIAFIHIAIIPTVTAPSTPGIIAFPVISDVEPLAPARGPHAAGRGHTGVRAAGLVAVDHEHVRRCIAVTPASFPPQAVLLGLGVLAFNHIAIAVLRAQRCTLGAVSAEVGESVHRAGPVFAFPCVGPCKATASFFQNPPRAIQHPPPRFSTS
eukprot:COSAG02_NODE_14022_length_1320_cov_1.782146_1_plen_249_part_00